MSDWIAELDVEKKKQLVSLLSRIQRYEGVYQHAEEPAIAQIWMALLDLSSRLERLEKKVRKLEIKLASVSSGSLLEDLKNY